MRVAHIITGLSTGGAELMLLRLVERLRGDFEQTVVSLTDFGPVGDKLAALGVSVFALGMSPTSLNPWAMLRLVRAIQAFRPDVVQTWLYHADLVGGVAARLAGVRAVVWNIRNNDLSVNRTSLRTRVVVKTCGLLSRYVPSRIVYCSQAAMQTHHALGYTADRSVFMPNGFDLNRFKPDTRAYSDVRQELGLTDDALLIGLIARFDPQKDHALFFEAAGRLHSCRPNVHFLLAGRGIDAANVQLIQWAQAAGVADVTHLLGERADVPRLTAALDIASSSSWGEAFPNVLGEAMACGVPCVATDAGDAALIVGGTGLIVPRGNAAALAQAWDEMLALSHDERQALGAQARARVSEFFELGAISRRYAALYREVITVSRT